MMKLPIAAAIAIMSAMVSPSFAQGTGSAPGDFTVERVLTLNSIVAPTPPSFPDAVLAGLKAGAIEIHQRFTYNSAQQTVEQLAFVVPGGSSVPFPDPSGAPVGDHYILQVDSITMTSSPRPSINFVGHVLFNDVPTPWGDITGAGVTLTVGYNNAGSATTFGPILESVSPLYGLYTDTGAGSLSLVPKARACNNATLNGTYMFQLAGSLQGSAGFAPWAETGAFQADGNGNITVMDSGNLGGSVFQGRTFPIVYTVNENCSGTFTFGSSAMDIQLSRDGRTIYMVFTKPGNVITNGTGQRQ